MLNVFLHVDMAVFVFLRADIFVLVLLVAEWILYVSKLICLHVYSLNVFIFSIWKCSFKTRRTCLCVSCSNVCVCLCDCVCFLVALGVFYLCVFTC